MAPTYSRHNPYSPQDFGADDEPTAPHDEEAARCRGCGKEYCGGSCPEFAAYMAEAWAALDQAEARANADGPITALLERADAVAARYDAAVAAQRAEPFVRANHTCEAGGLCAACAAHDERLMEIEQMERAKERTR